MKTQETHVGETMQLGRDLEGAAAREGGVTRRGFVGGMGAMMAAAALAAGGSKAAFADEAEEAEVEEAVEEETAEAEEETAVEEEAEETATEEETTAGDYPTITSTCGWTGTPEDVLALGVSTMPLDDLNQYRQLYLDAQTEYTMEDGTVVTLPYVQMRALINTYGQDSGNTPVDASYSELLRVFSEDDCQAFIDMPWGVEFTAYEMAAKEGRTVEECEELCERIASEGFMIAYDTNRGRCYHQVPSFQGTAEYTIGKYFESDGEYSCGLGGSDYYLERGTSGTPTFYTVPVDASVTSDGTILPLDDLKEKVKNANLACITPCACRLLALVDAYGHENIPSFEDFHTGEYEDYYSDLCDQRVETCIQIGDEAAYWIEMGFGRKITGEQAAEYLQRSVDDGFILESTFGRDNATICSCHLDSCYILNGWMSLGEPADIAATAGFQQISHYTLEVDSDLCIACGACVDRCPVRCISINDEGWAEADVDCFRCGQCAYVCPQGARKLVERDESELAPLPEGMLEDANVKAAYRFEKGLITFPEA